MCSIYRFVKNWITLVFLDVHGVLRFKKNTMTQEGEERFCGKHYGKMSAQLADIIKMNEL